MLMDAFVLACLSSVGLMFLYKKLPRKVRRFIAAHGILTDFATFILTYFTLGASLTALTAGAMVGIFTSIIIHVMNNPQDYLYLWDLKKAMEKQFASIQSDLKTYGKNYREKMGYAEDTLIPVESE